MSEDITLIQGLPMYKKKFLYASSAEWCRNNFYDYSAKFFNNGGIQITAIVDSNHSRDGMGLIKAYLRNWKTGKCFDVRGEFATDQDILRYTGIDYNDYENENVEKYTFDDKKPFEVFLHWLEFEREKDRYQFFD